MAMTTSVLDHHNSQIPANSTTSPNAGQGSEGLNYETADHWSKISVSYSQSGDQAAALNARQKAVEVYRLLHAKQPGLFEGNLARELLGLSKDLAGNGRIEEAFKASQESGRLYRHILGNSAEYDRIQCQGYWGLVNPSTHIPKFVQSLTQLSKSILYGMLARQSKSIF
ncbi:hypothetical protein RSAG8_03686, partial [Rhizoctonia solani AG-8 WAC10335]